MIYLDIATVQWLNELISNIDEVKDTLKATITNVLADVPLDELDEQIRNLQREMMELNAKKTSGRIVPDAYAKQGSKLSEKIDALKK